MKLLQKLRHLRHCRGMAGAVLATTSAVCAPLLSAYNADEEPITINSRFARYDYKPGEIIVKFKTNSKVRMKSNSKGQFASAGVSNVDKVLKDVGIESTEALMPLSGGAQVPRKLKAFNGSDVFVKDLSKLYVIKMADNVGSDVSEAIAKIRELDEVEYAEPNYIVHALEAELSETPNDPFYNLQYGISAINLPKLWGAPVISKDGPVIAILDTGVEIEHPDLAENIWENPAESNGAEDYDDDRNGYADDINGWDFVNQTGKIVDYNGHGTHCAGIAAACGFNGKGIIGANPGARIMPLTVLQSNGKGDIGTIIKALDYAAANGADIISMSLGTYSTSSAFEEALGRAYSKSVIIAAAGNDGYCLNHLHLDRGQMSPMPMFPAAYTFVLGVQASDPNNSLAGFSNYDDNGATYSEYSEEQLYNYELTVPGVTIMSTYPGGNYKYLNGTSMATPLAAGAVSRLLQSKEYINKEELFGDIIHSTKSNGILDIFSVYNIKSEDRKPELQFVTFEMVDADGDGRADAGEEVEFYPVIRNYWGNASNIICSIASAETVNNTFEILEGETKFGVSLSSYGKAKSENPLRIRLNKNVADGRILRLKFTATADNIDPIEREMEIMVENAVTLTGILREDMTLTPDQHYVVTGTFGVPEELTLTILPGTKIIFREKATMRIDGRLIADGLPGRMITFTQDNPTKGSIRELHLNHGKISYCVFENLNATEDLSNFGYLMSSIDTLANCIIRNCDLNRLATSGNSNKRVHYESSAIYNNTSGRSLFDEESFRYCNINNITQCVFGIDNYLILNPESSGKGLFACNTFNNPMKYIDSEPISGTLYWNSMGFLTPEMPCYLGTGSESIAKNRVVDINHPLNDYFNCISEYDFSNMPTRPYAEAPGIVWKVVVDGYDAQDQFDEMPPLGVGRHKFEVYFNRPMNKAVAPVVAMGIRPPYTQTGVGEEGKWNDDGTIYTAYLTISGKSNIDGLNRIHVSAAEDDEFFEIPVEDSRFNVLVQAAGSMSEGFYAEAGLGKVDLVWESSEEEVDDILGYNVYRYCIDESGNATDSLQLNKRLINVTSYTDFEVEPGTTYLYYYKTMRTDMSENSASKVVAAKPLTASKGDANGSMSVDVADVVTEVNYIIGGNPQPFIFDAADVNTDSDINVLDIVGTINIINTPTDAAAGNSTNELSTAMFSVEDGVLYVECEQPLGGLQVRLNSDKSSSIITKVSDLSGFEEIANWVSDNEYLYMIFSMSGQTLSPGKHALLNIGEATISEVTVSDAKGRNMPAVLLSSGPSSVGEIATCRGDFRVYPNPADDVVNLDYLVPCDCKVFFTMNNIRGSHVGKFTRISTAGKNTVSMNVSKLPAGIYFIQMICDGKNIKTFKFIKK